MNDWERKHYAQLRANFWKLVDETLGKNYFTVSADLYNSDMEAFRDMMDYIEGLKKDVNLYRSLFYFMVILLCLVIIWFV